MAEFAFIRNGRMVGSPMQGLAGYDLKRLSADQTLQLSGIMAKANADQMLTPTDLKNIMAIRKAAATPAAAATDISALPKSYQALGAAIAAFAEAVKS